ncbi:MAG TPA: histidine phosphatase family protein [Lachnospiraceae bacterium]|nr:histidine phosphatase family protein [Lachnospiraceae bacterium]
MIYIVRHGQTEMNNRKVLQGRSDYPLNGAGIAQAQKAADELKHISFTKVYTSPLKRAVQTAEIIAPKAHAVIDDRLIEMDYGPYEGTDLNRLPSEILTFFSDFVHNPAPDGMEQLSSVVERAGNFLEEIRNLEGDILISTHAIAMKGILEYLTPGSDGAYWSKYIGNCAVYAAENRNGTIGVPKEWKAIHV